MPAERDDGPADGAVVASELTAGRRTAESQLPSARPAPTPWGGVLSSRRSLLTVLKVSRLHESWSSLDGRHRCASSPHAIVANAQVRRGRVVRVRRR